MKRISERLDAVALNNVYDEMALRIGATELRAMDKNGMASTLTAVLMGNTWDGMHVDIMGAANQLRMKGL